MGPCERYADRWLDHLYGLLSDQESRELADHAATCPSCQSALAEAQRDQGRMARAARWIRDVPEFQLPADEAPAGEAPVGEAPVGEAPQVAAPLRIVTPAVPAGPPVRKPLRRSLAQRLWPVWVAAAALLLAIFYGIDTYWRGGAEREQAVAKVKRQLDGVEAQFISLKRQADAEQQTILQQAKAETLRLFVIGAAQAHADAPYACRVATRDLDGRPAPADLDVRLVRADTGDVVHRQTVTSRGDVDVLIPAGLKLDQSVLDKGVRLEVAAKHGPAQAEIRERLTTAPATHVLHLALNKSMYQYGEVVFFRALALERYSLKPPSHSLPLKFALVNAQGKAVFEVEAKTGPGGIAGGEFALVSGLNAGVYSIQASVADPKLQIQTQSRGLEVVERLSDIDVRPEPKVYRAGDTVIIHVTARGADGKPLSQQLVKAIPGVEIKSGIASNRAMSYTGKEGEAKVTFPLPKGIESSRLNVHLELPGLRKDPKDPTGALKMTRSIAVMPSRLDVDFYPEGGDLVAGVAQRVYFRVRAPSGETAAPDGKWSLHSTKGLIFESKPGESLGAFTFTPDAQESYTLRVPAGSGVGENKKPFEALGIQAEGVVLHVANSVAAEGEAARLALKCEGPEQKLLAVATCRGQIVAQRFIETKTSHVNVVNIALPNGVRGIVRLTLYAIRDQRLTPVAERLVYRTPAERLDLTAMASNFGPGQQGKIDIEARSENGKPASAWALAVVVDDRYRAERNERSLAGWVMLGSEFGADVAEAPLLADDSPATRAALELFLGTRGWRRFVPQAEQPQREQAQFAQEKSTPRLFSAENLNPEQARALVTAKAERGLTKLQQRIDRERGRLSEQREQLGASLTAAIEARAAYARAPWEYFRLGLGSLAALAFAAGSLGLIFGLARLLRGQASRRALAGALGALGVCLALYLPAASLTEIVEFRSDDAAALSKWQDIVIGKRGQFVSPPPAPLAGQVALAAPPAPSTPTTARHAADLAGALVMNVPGAVMSAPVRATFTQHPQWQQRFQSAATMQRMKSGLEFGREFALSNPGDDAQPTLLWHPQLRLDKGQASVAFDVPKTPASYRVLIYGHTDDGRLGFYEQRIQVK